MAKKITSKSTKAEILEVLEELEPVSYTHLTLPTNVNV